MKAVVQRDYQGIDSLQIVEIAAPKASLLGTLVDVKNVPVLPWDIKNERGELGQLQQEQLPRILGYGFAGVVQQSHPLGLAKGIRVIGASPNGTYAEIVNASIPLYLFSLPDNVDLVDAATIFGGADTALMMLNSVPLAAEDQVLVIGASGGVGGYLVQLLQARGINVQILSSAQSLSYTKQTYPKAEVISDVKQMTNNSIKAIFDTAGNINLLRAVEAKLITGGTLFAAGTPNYQQQRSDIHSIFKNHPISPKQYQQLITMLSNRTLKAHISQIFKLKDVKKAQHFEAETPSRGRVIIEV